MRTDATIDTADIPCPNAHLLGFNRGVAHVGDCILYKEHYEDGTYNLRIARVLGRVSAPKLAHNEKAIKGYVLVMALADDAESAYERWVNPADVAEVFDTPTRMLQFFARPVLPPAETVRKLMAQGYICDRYLPEDFLKACGVQS